MKAYLTQRFLESNCPKYYKYVNDWINNITLDQLKYFIEEKRRLNK